jgi:hypothetical protein
VRCSEPHRLTAVDVSEGVELGGKEQPVRMQTLEDVDGVGDGFNNDPDAARAPPYAGRAVEPVTFFV